MDDAGRRSKSIDADRLGKKTQRRGLAMIMQPTKAIVMLGILAAAIHATVIEAAEDWRQLKYDGRHSGDVPDRRVTTPLGLLAARPLGDAVLTAPAIADGRVYVIDASGGFYILDADTLDVIAYWQSPGGETNVNNVSSPAVAGRYVHFGTTAGKYYVVDPQTAAVVNEIDCGEPIFSAPVVSGDRVYFATLGSQVYALEPDGTVAWRWDFVREVLDFDGNRWSGADWLAYKQGRVTWRDAFCCSTDVAAFDGMVVVPAGGRTIWLADAGDHAELHAIGLVPSYAGSEYPATFGQSIGPDGAVYRQWHRRDNAGRVEILRCAVRGQRLGGRVQGSEKEKGGASAASSELAPVETSFVPGTETAINLPGLLSFSSVSIRGDDVYRTRPEMGFGFCRHRPDREEGESLGGYPAIASPILVGDRAVFGGLDGRLYVVPLSGRGEPWSFATASGAPISAPASVADGRIYFGSEDGHLYALGPDGKATSPDEDLRICEIRNPISSNLPGSEFDWYTNYGNVASTNANNQGVKPPFAIKWIRRYEGTFKHLPVCGGGRMYTHTAEGQIFAVEQETGRLLWRRYFPDVHLSFTSPIYQRERLLVPQAGIRQSRLRCLDAATGKLIWETPFSGSPSWSRQGPPVVYKELAIYSFGSGRYAPQGTEKAFVHKGQPQPSPDGSEVMSWIYSHNNPYYPSDNRPLVRAWDVDSGNVAWERDFSEFGSGGNDSGLCLAKGVLYYSTFFGYAAERRGTSGARGLTAALDPATGEVLWSTTEHYVTAGCTISVADGRLYLGGYNRPNESTQDRYVWCLDAADGSLVWQSEPVASSVNVVSLGDDYLFSNASGKDGHVFDRATGKILSRFNFGYACTRFTMSEPYVMGANMDMIDLADGNRLVTSGPAIDSRECVGSVVSNGRIFYTSQASGLQVSLVYGDEAAKSKRPWLNK